MDVVTILWSFCAAVAIVLAMAWGLLWLSDRRSILPPLICVLGFATGAAAFVELGMMHSTSVVEYREWLHWYYLPITLTLIGEVLFVHFYLGTSRAWLVWAIVLARSVVAIVVLLNIKLVTVVSLRRASLFGEQVSTTGVVVPSAWQWLAVASLILLMAYVLDAVARQWWKGGRDSRRKALAVGLGMVIPLSCTTVYTQLLAFGILQGVVSNVPWFLGTLLVLAYEWSRDFVLSRRTQLEVAELRAQLAHEERVAVLGQLASALAHELGQPLTATTANAQAALILLQREELNLEEVRAIVKDIQDNSRGAAEIVIRMHRFFKRRAMEMRPLRVEDIVQDAVSLARSEAISKHITLSLRIEPGIPDVVGDRVHLSQVILNLIMNGIHAVQSLPRDARTIVIEASADDVKSEVEVAVRDSGTGISEDIANEIFKPFFTTKLEGTGIGLALSRSIIEAHGGRLWADRVPQPEGSVFRFTLRPCVAPKARTLLEGN